MLDNWNIAFWEYEFLAPNWLWLFVILPLFFWLLFRLEKRRKGEMKFSGSEKQQFQLGSERLNYFRWFFVSSYMLAFSCIIFAMARPYHWSSYDDFDTEYKRGIDIILSMDISLSMLARDFEPNRLEASKRVAQEFIAGRRGDRIGLVVYEGEAYTVCPATLDYDILNKQIERLQPGNMEGGTAIGVGLGTAVTRLRNDSIQSKVIILLTDGVNNQGTILPLEAAELAKSKGVRVYTIGVGSLGMAPYPVFTPFGMRYENMPVEIDEQTMQRIADITGGKYFRATDESSLRNIYKEIDKLEKREIKHIDFKSEPPATPLPFIKWGIVFLLIPWFIKTLYLKANA